MSSNFRFLLSVFVAVFCLLAGASYPQKASEKVQKPNILWLVTEDISPFISSYGDATAKTPNLDRLAREGVRYANVFDVSGVCAPSRSCLITGMYPTSIGTDNMRTLNAFPEIGIPKYSVVLPPEVKMFSELMRKGGYYCTNNNKQDYQFVAPKSGWDESSKNAHWRNGPQGKPFFSVFNFEVTHESQIWKKKNDPLLVDPAKVPLPPYYPESPVIRKDVARMYSNIMEMDQQVGEILRQLEADGLLDKTIIVWYSDNGGPLPRGKREIYDTGLHVPMIIRFPNKQQAGTVQSQLVSFVDFAPSTLTMAGVPVPQYMQGKITFGVNGPKENRKYVFAARDRMDSEYDMVRAVRDSRYKYIRNFQPEKPYMQNIIYRKDMDLMRELLKFEAEGKLNPVQQLWFRKSKPQDEFYDTLNDPYELNNLIADPQFTAKINELKAALADWMKLTDDKGFIPEKKWIESFWPAMKQPATQDPVFSQNGGTVSIASATDGASISYQVIAKGQQVKEKQWRVYTGPVKLADNQTVAAIAERIGYKSSAIKEFSK
ncbi:MAG: sulfatase [Sphingobacteriaceae bacterium]|jgi:arylsulfatase A-like enzyme|nr:sulfatase [Sphingobacteriaceae bacterium]